MIESAMRSVWQAQQLASWILRRYMRFVLLGALTTCASLNLALHSGLGMGLYCKEECLISLLRMPMSSLDKYAVKHIQNYWIDPPFKEGLFKPDFNVLNPPWAKMGKWGEGMDFVVNFFKHYKEPGVFVEVGAQDGEFMSLSLWLELEKKFSGLLVEPNPHDYDKLRAKKRAAYSINACATPDVGHRKDILWLRDTPKNLPILLKRIQEGSNRLIGYVSVEDRELGKEVPVQCFNLAAMIAATLKTFHIDFLSISTHGGEIDILQNLPYAIKIRMLVLMAPLATADESEELDRLAAKRGLTRIFDRGTMHMFISKAEVVVVPAVKN